MIEIKVAFSDLREFESVLLEQLRLAYPTATWVIDQDDADLTISMYPLEVVNQQVLVLGTDDPGTVMLPKLARALTSGGVFLPVGSTIELLRGRLIKEVEQYAQLRDNNPLVIPQDEKLDGEFITDVHPLAVYHIHGTAMLNYAPDLEKKLSARTYRTLQRNIPSYKPMSGFGCPELEEEYRKTPADGKELGARIEKVKDRLIALDVTPSASSLEHSQIGGGIFTPGGQYREDHNLALPDDDLTYWMEWAAKFMLRGLHNEYITNGDAGVEQLYTRCGVKVDNYQGPYLNTSFHPIRQAMWQMQIEEGGPFALKWLPALCTSGFRTQSNGWGKCRPTAVPGEDLTVIFSRVLDGDDLAGKKVAIYAGLDATQPLFLYDSKAIGGRKRVVANVSSYLNDSLLPIPSFLGQTKDAAYKYIYQQDLDILSRFVSCSDQFIKFWKEGYEQDSNLRKLVKKNFSINTLEEFITYISKIGELVACGDVMSYDASATWSFLLPFLRTLLAKDALSRTEEIFNSDKIGVYCDHRGVKRFYYILCTPDESFPEWKNELIRETRKAMSSLPSGLAITAQCGRGPVLAVLIHLLERCVVRLGVSKSEFREFVLESIPEFGSGFVWSFVSAWTNDGGDDHNLGMLILHLITGVDIKECLAVLEDEFEKYEFLKLEPENPKTNCGYRFHDESQDNPRCIGVSLAPERMWDNNTNPEYPKSFLGMKSSLDLYIHSALGTPVEDKMIEVASIIINDVMGLNGYEELDHFASIEESYLRDNESMIPARQRIALFLNIPENQLEYMYTLQELADLEVPEDWISTFRRPLPPELSTNAYLFFNAETIRGQ